MASKNVLFSLLLLLLVVLYAPPKALANNILLNTVVSELQVTGNLTTVPAGSVPAGSVATVGISYNGETTFRGQTTGRINQLFLVSVFNLSGILINDSSQSSLTNLNAIASFGGQQYSSNITLVSITPGTTAGGVAISVGHGETATFLPLP